MLVQIQEVVTLYQLVREFCEGHAIAFTVEALLDRVLGHHIVDGDVLADVADEVEEGELAHPVVVVDEHCGIATGFFKVEEFLQLLPDASLVVTQSVGIQ